MWRLTRAGTWRSGAGPPPGASSGCACARGFPQIAAAGMGRPWGPAGFLRVPSSRLQCLGPLHTRSSTSAGNLCSDVKLAPDVCMNCWELSDLKGSLKTWRRLLSIVLGWMGGGCHLRGWRVSCAIAPSPACCGGPPGSRHDMPCAHHTGCSAVAWIKVAAAQHCMLFVSLLAQRIPLLLYV